MLAINQSINLLLFKFYNVYMYIRELIVHVYFTQSTNFTILYTIKNCVQLLCYFAFEF